MTDNIIALKRKKALSPAAQREEARRLKAREIETQIQQLIAEYQTLTIDGETGDLYQYFKEHNEAHFFRTLLLYVNHDEAAAAALLGMDRFTLQRKLDEHRLFSH